MSDQTDLERRYRRLLACYPRPFRRDNGQELLTVLLSCARDGQRRPSLAESADLVRSGLTLRLRPGLPRSARTVEAAVRLMYAGAAFTVLVLVGSIISVAVLGPNAATLTLGGQTQPLPVTIAVGVVGGLGASVLWFWMARATRRGRTWARVLTTVLLGLATMQLVSVAQGSQRPVGLVYWVPTCLVGFAAVWLLWRPASSEFFKAGHGSDEGDPLTRNSVEA